MFYAVHRGRIPGIYRTWSACHEQIHKFPHAVYKKFNTRENAEAFVTQGQRGDLSGKVRKVHKNQRGSDIGVVREYNNLASNTIQVYTDGSCLYNGTKRAKAGVGVYFGQDDPRNMSHPLSRGERQTNNRAEMTAIVEAIEQAEPELAKGHPLVIHTDSEYSMRVLGEYGRRCQGSGWNNTYGLTPPNLDLMQRGLTLLDRYPSHIDLHHVPAHTGSMDVHSLGNKQADRLAVEGAGMS
jgi:ribonuclease HI